MVEFRNPKYSSVDKSIIDVEINHMELGWIPFTATENDPEQFGRDLFASIIQSGDIDPYVEPPAPPLPPLTARQLRLGLVAASILPSQVDAAIAAIEDDTARAVAEIEWEYATQFERDHPLIEQVGMALDLSSEQIDTMWQAALNI